MKKTENIASAALLLATSILLSRILGYAREMLLAWKFGATSATDAFYAAFQIPDLLNYFLAGGALSIAFIPLYNRVLARDGMEAANKLMANVLGTLGALVIALTALLWWQAEPLVRFQFPAFDEATRTQTVNLTRIVLPAQIFFITGGIVQAVLLAHRHFIAAAIAPLIYNACTIAGGLLLHSCCGIAGFAWGTLLGSFLGPFLMPVLFGWRRFPLRFSIAPGDRNFLIYIAIAAPLMFGQTLLTLDEWYDRWFGALLATGTVAHLGFARKLMQVPIAVIGQAIGAAALPTLAKLWAEDKVEELNKTLTQTLKTGLALAVLAGGAFFALAQPLVALVYLHGAFTGEDAMIVAMLTALFALAVPGWIAQQIIVRAFYARGDTLKPMILGTIVALLAAALYYGLSQKLGVTGLALAGVTGMTVNAAATILYARKIHAAPPLLPLLGALGRGFAIAVPGGAAAFGALFLRARHLPLEALQGKGLALFDFCLGGGVYALAALPLAWFIGEEGLKSYFHGIVKRVLRR